MKRKQNQQTTCETQRKAVSIRWILLCFLFSFSKKKMAFTCLDWFVSFVLISHYLFRSRWKMIVQPALNMLIVADISENHLREEFNFHIPIVTKAFTFSFFLLLFPWHRFNFSNCSFGYLSIQSLFFFATIEFFNIFLFHTRKRSLMWCVNESKFRANDKYNFRWNLNVRTETRVQI